MPVIERIINSPPKKSWNSRTHPGHLPYTTYLTYHTPSPSRPYQPKHPIHPLIPTPTPPAQKWPQPQPQPSQPPTTSPNTSPSYPATISPSSSAVPPQTSAALSNACSIPPTAFVNPKKEFADLIISSRLKKKKKKRITILPNHPSRSYLPDYRIINNTDDWGGVVLSFWKKFASICITTRNINRVVVGGKMGVCRIWKFLRNCVWSC